jgi:hypothetical protein
VLHYIIEAGGIPELALVIGVSFISESPRWLVMLTFISFQFVPAFPVLESTHVIFALLASTFVHLQRGSLCGQVKAGQEEELSSCLQKLRGKEFDVGNEIAEIQVFWVC